MAEKKIKTTTKTTVKKTTRVAKKVTLDKVATKKPKAVKKTVKVKPKLSPIKFTEDYPVMSKAVARPVDFLQTKKMPPVTVKSLRWHEKTFHPLGEHDHLPHHHSVLGVVVVSVLALVLLCFVIFKPSLQLTFAEPNLSKHYESSTYQFSFDYPAKWQVSEFTLGNGETGYESVVLENGEQSIVIYTVGQISESTLVPGSSYDETINGQKVTRYRDFNPATGGLMERVVIERPDGKWHELRGYGPLFERVLNSFVVESN